MLSFLRRISNINLGLINLYFFVKYLVKALLEYSVYTRVCIDLCASLEETRLHSNEITLPSFALLSQDNVHITFEENRLNP